MTMATGGDDILKRRGLRQRARASARKTHVLARARVGLPTLQIRRRKGVGDPTMLKHERTCVLARCARARVRVCTCPPKPVAQRCSRYAHAHQGLTLRYFQRKRKDALIQLVITR